MTLHEGGKTVVTREPGEQGRSQLVSVVGQDRVEFNDNLSVGRHPANDLVLSHVQVSGRHALLEWDGAGWRLFDLGSRNGTWVNGKPARQGQHILAGDRIQFGKAAAWRAELVEPRSPELALLNVELVASGRRVPVTTDRFLIGTGPPCDLRVEEWLDGAPSPVRLVLFEEVDRFRYEVLDGCQGLLVDGEEAPAEAVDLTASVEVQLGPTAIRILPPDGGGVALTQQGGRHEKHYDLTLALDFDRPNGGRITASVAGQSWTVRARQRFILLHLLARAGGEWITDDVLKAALWGKSGSANVDRSSLHKLIHDTRQMFAQRGVDGWFIEKRRGTTRLRLGGDQLTLTGNPSDSRP